MQCAAAQPPPVPALLAGPLPRVRGEACPELAVAARECAGPARPWAGGRPLRWAAKAAAVLLHAALLLLVVFLETQPPVARDAPLVCTLDLASLLPADPAPAPCQAPAVAPVPAPRPAARRVAKPKPAPPAPVVETLPVSTAASSQAKAPEPASEPASAEPAAPSGPAASTGGALAAAEPAARLGGVSRDATGAGSPSGRGYELSQVDAGPRLTHRHTPEYPYSARSRNLSGTVTVRFLVEEDGTVDELTVLSAEPAGVFESSVLKAVRRWRFKPGERGGRPVPTWVVLPVRFDLTG